MEQSRTITRKSASNLALAFVVLPREKQDAMSALYAFCRRVDDIADDESVPVNERRAELAEWRADIQRACGTEQPRFPVNRELQPFVHAYKLPYRLFDELIRGVEMDLEICRYRTQADLETYCYHVASVVGLLSIEIFGYSDARCQTYALHLGKALQLTNILRDVRTDAERGRIYLPLDDLQQHNVTEQEILSGLYSDRFQALAKTIHSRAAAFYRTARENLPPQDRKHMLAAETMGAVYWDLLQELERRHFRVFGPSIRLSKPRKLSLVLRTWMRIKLASNTPNYG